MTGWTAFEDEVARWRDAGRAVELWWRDDDAADAGPALDRLLMVRRDLAVPLALAVVPARATPALAARLAAEPAVDVLQHGYAHVNHATPAEKKIELGGQRPAMLVLGELATGRLALERLFGRRPLAVLVPPWNRIAPALVAALPEIGFNGLSTFGSRQRREAVRGLRLVNAHLDVIDWKAGRRFVGEDIALAAVTRALAVARAGSGEPVGVLSHHLAMDDTAWDFLVSFWRKATTMRGVTLRSAQDLFASREPRA